MSFADWGLTLNSRPAIQAAAEYRADIDGLRALAVLAVVGFHAFPSLFPGGFVGVDIFFVISGYLISGIILQGLNQGRFSFLQFYYRRIRRIFPALIVVLFACYLIGWTSLLAEEFRQLGSHIVAGAIFVSNFKYWSEAGYFDMAGEFKPLLHLWSLAVEEQFYILWPFLLWAVWKLRVSVLWFVVCVALASFALNIVYVERGALDAAFYSPAARFWELMLGAMLAAASSWQRDYSPFRCNAVSIIGILAVGSALLLIARDSRFPGWWALLPTVGTVLLIAAPGAWFNRSVLAHPWLVALGLISYPLYLWHWPLLSFARIFEGQTPPVAVRLAAVVVSVVLAWATYRLIERPIRFGKAVSGRFKAAVLSVAMVALAGAGYAARGGVPRSIAPQIVVNDGEIASERGHELFLKYQLDHNFLCTPERFRQWAVKEFAPARCVQSKNSDKIDIAIIGDSHAEDLFIGLAERLPDANIVTYIQTLPIRSNGVFNDVFDYVESDKNIRVVIMTAWWDYHQKFLPPGHDLQTELTATVGELVRAGKVVYLLDDRPAFPFFPDVCKYVRRRFFWQARRGTHCEFERPRYEAQRSQYLRALQAVAKQLPNVHLLDTSRIFCDDKFCRMGRDGNLFYRDQNHLTVAGSRAMAAELAREITFPIPERAAH